MPAETCATCKFWTWTGTGETGDCRRRAPAIAPDAAGRWTAGKAWPRVEEHDWCGEYDEHPSEAAQRREVEADIQAERDLDARYGAALAPPPGWPDDLDDKPF